MARQLYEVWLELLEGLTVPGRIYDRLPLQITQVLRDVQTWRAHQRNHRDACAESTLRQLQESADELDRWEAEKDPSYRTSDPDLVVARSPNPNAPKTKLRLVHDADKDDE